MDIKLAHVVVAASGFAVRKPCVLSLAWQACHGTHEGGNCLPWKKIQFSVAVAERASHHWECVVWTHPESPPPLQVALINHADMALTLFYLSWRNPVLPAPQTLLWWQERLNEVLVVAGGGLTGLWPPELWSGDLG